MFFLLIGRGTNNSKDQVERSHSILLVFQFYFFNIDLF